VIKKMIYWFLLIAGFLGLASYLAGLWGTGEYIRNFEAEEFDPQHEFVKPVVIRDGLAVYRVGEGQPVLLFPYPHAGTTAPMAQNALTEIFTELGYMVITFDVPGAYASTREPQVDMAEMLQCALEALEAADVEDEVVVAGHSMGGLVALGFALEYPQRVDRLLLINSLSGFDASLKWGLPGSAWSWYEKEYWQLMYWGIRLQNGRGDLAIHKRLMNMLTEASYVDKSMAPLLEIGDDDIEIPTPVRFRWSNAVWHVNYADRLGEITMPTLITGSRFDPQTPLPCAEQLAEGIPTNELVVFENSGHIPFVEERDIFIDVVRQFLIGE
jgi:pimeloyl-ACP methyl ester carboxylesterase